jgi:hypothetical protein
MPIRALTRRRSSAVHRVPAALLTGAVAGCLVLAGGCGDATTQPSGTSSRSSPSSSPNRGAVAASTPPSTPGPGDPATTSAPPAPSATTSSLTKQGAGKQGGPLLAAETLPASGLGHGWRAVATSHREPVTPLGTCQRFGLLSIGAERVVVRRYVPAGASARGDRAAEAVADFPDPMTARRAYAVLMAWHAQCAKNLARYRQHVVGPLQDVPVGAGSGAWYLLRYGPVHGHPLLEADGTAVAGSAIAVLSMVTPHAGAAATPGPAMRTAVGRAAGLLG